jgi:hypothetical protein
MKRALTLLAMTLCFACQNENKQAPIMKTDISELSKLIKLPVTPLSAKWMVSSPASGGRLGPNDFTVIAMLTFTDEGTRLVETQSDVPPDAEPLALKDDELPLFFTAAEAKSWERPSQGFVVVPGKTYGPAAFAKSPYLKGKVAVVEGRPNLVLLTLYTS